MLPADQLELLTAAVDGELTPRQARRLRRLLAASAEARALFDRLTADSTRLRALPKASPPADLTARIMAKVAAATPPPAVPASTLPRPRERRWVPVAVAASLLLAVTGASFWFFTRAHGRPVGDGVVKNGDKAPSPRAGVPGRETADALPSEHSRPPSEPIVDDPWDDIPAPRDTTPSTLPPPRPRRNPAPSVRPNPDLIGGVPLPALPPFDRVRVRLPFLAAATELDREDTRAALLEGLRRDSAARVDVFVRDPIRAAELLQTAARQSGLAVHTDAAAADRVKTRKPTAAFLLFTEALSPAEVRDLLAKVAAADAKAATRVLDTVHVTPLHPADQRDLSSNVLGFDVTLLRKPGTEPKPGERSAVVVTYHPPGVRTVPALSKELVRFATRRGDRRPNAMAVVIVVRQAGN